MNDIGCACRVVGCKYSSAGAISGSASTHRPRTRGADGVGEIAVPETVIAVGSTADFL
jgi:hypothetical protein